MGKNRVLQGDYCPIGGAVEFLKRLVYLVFSMRRVVKLKALGFPRSVQLVSGG